MVGMNSRGCSSLGTKAYGLQRVRWNGGTPFAIREKQARHDGFELVFTEPVDEATALHPASYAMKNYTYSSSYGRDEIEMQTLKIASVKQGSDKHIVQIVIEGLRPLYVHELRADGVRSARSAALEHTDAYYTVARIPNSSDSPKAPGKNALK